MFEPKIIAYLCTWCSYTGADTAGISRLKSPANLRAVRVPCSGRVSPELILRTFDQGADGVLVLGCHIGECHYDSGNHRAAKRMPALQALLAFAGLEPERLRLDWVSASEGERFARIASEFTETVRALGPVRWRVEEREARVEGWGSRVRSRGSRVEGGGGRNTNLESRISDPDEAIQEAIRREAQELLMSGQVDCVIGYEQGTHGRARPTFVYHAENAGRLVWNSECSHNLTGYLREKLHKERPGATRRPSAAVVVKPCDSRAINVLLAENQFERDQVHLIGVACEGVYESAPGGQRRLQERCLECEDRVPLVYDTLIGERSAGESRIDRSTDREVAWLESLTPAEKMAFWNEQFDRCIRCYACRQVCPMCNCPTCLYERDDSLWVGMGTGINEKRTFHLGRAFHLAGRCIDCRECERVCPMGIPIGLLNHMLAQEIETKFGFRPGLEPGPSPLVTILSERSLAEAHEEGQP